MKPKQPTSTPDKPNPDLVARCIAETNEASRTKPHPDALRRAVETVLGAQPFARLHRDGANATRYSISVPGVSRAIASSDAASGAWLNAQAVIHQQNQTTTN